MREYELQAALQKAAQAIVQNDPNPSTWLRSLITLLQELEGHSRGANPMYSQIYEDMLAYLQDAIHNRLQTGGW